MGKFLENEKPRLAAWKQETSDLSMKARSPGMFLGKMRDFCLPVGCAEENLFSGSRLASLQYCAAYGVKWHQGQKGKCSNHLCDSMVSCFNFLFPFSDKPEALAALLRPVIPSIKRMLPLEDSGLWMAFEWIGLQNYLGEMVRGDSQRTRGANFTSADAAVRFEDDSGCVQVALIEWKYTESYGRSSKARGSSGERRQSIYRRFFDAPDSPIDAAKVPDYQDLFYEPFYQMMRQQLLAHEMEKARELEAEVVTVVHISPAKNRDFLRVTSPGLEPLGDSALGVWASLLRRPERFVSVHAEDLFGAFDTRAFPSLSGWYDYIQSRYAL
jgi:hypothetical protein